jgi:hypothetical protein
MTETFTVKVTYKAFGNPKTIDVVLPTIVGKYVDDLHICEQIFKQTNTYTGPIYDQIIERGEGRTHTSLSVGDEVEINGQVYICADFGFEKIEDVEIKTFDREDGRTIVFSVSPRVGVEA